MNLFQRSLNRLLNNQYDKLIIIDMSLQYLQVMIIVGITLMYDIQVEFQVNNSQIKKKLII